MIKMRERKYVKFRVDMLSDTKSKIIDMKPERDLIHYVWMALVLLAGKINLEGDLYMSKNIPYTIETLAIEFHRDTFQVKLALDVLMELEMMELAESNVYRVKNFAKHQNIKVKKEDKSNDKGENIKKNEVEIKESQINESVANKNEVHLEVAIGKANEADDKISKNKEENLIDKLENINSNIDEIDGNISDHNISNDKLNNLQSNIPILLETKKSRKLNKRKKKEVNIDVIDEEIGKDVSDCFRENNNDGEEDGIYFYDSDEGRPLEEGERVVEAWTF
jgi:predicted phage replisome organizer